MAKRITRIGEGIYQIIYESEPEIVNIKDLENQVKELEKQLQQVEPSKKELEDWAKANHPYYPEMETVRIQVDKLNNRINELKSSK